MKIVSKGKWVLESRGNAIALGVCALYLVYWIVFMANPFFEGDAANMLSGAVQISRGVDNPITYRYDNQPLYTLVLALFAKLFGSSVTWLAVSLSVASLLTVLTSGFLLAKRMVSERFATCFAVVFLLIHELVISATYPNSSIFAMAFLCLAIYVLVRFNYSLAAVVTASMLMILAFYSRNDSLLMFPYFFLILIFKKRYFLIFGALFTIICSGWLMMHLLGVDFTQALRNTSRHFSQAHTAIDHVSFICFSAMPITVILLFCLGITDYILKKKRYILLLIAVAILPIFLFYMRRLTSPKYLLYCYPVFAWVAVRGWFMLENLPLRFISYLARGIMVLLLAVQLVFRISLPLWLDVCSLKERRWYITADGPRPITGVLHFPVEIKEENKKQKKIFKLILSTGVGHNRVYWTRYLLGMFLRYNFSMKAKQIIRESVGGIKAQIFILPDDSRVIVRAKLIKGRLHEKISKKIEIFRKQGYMNIIYAFGLKDYFCSDIAVVSSKKKPYLRRLKVIPALNQ